MEVDSLKQYKLYARCIPSGECSQCSIGGRSIVYGFFKSRRRGLSIGINLFPLAKVCSFNCIYCFRGSTDILTVEPVDDGSEITIPMLLKALEIAIEDSTKISSSINAIDFSGRGEPTLHPKFNEFLDAVKFFLKNNRLDVSVGVFTNSSTLHRENIAKAFEKVDYVEAKLDTVLQYEFEYINMPCRTLRIDMIIENLKNFRKRFRETFVIQTMLLYYGNLTNSSPRDAEALAEKLAVIEPDEVHLYTVYRVPRMRDVKKVGEEVMENFAKILRSYGLKVEIYPK